MHLSKNIPAYFGQKTKNEAYPLYNTALQPYGQKSSQKEAKALFTFSEPTNQILGLQRK